MDRSGLIIFAFGEEFNQFVIRDVIQASPAEEADIRPEDILVKIHGFPTHFFSLEEINGMLQKKPGKKVKLVIKREGHKLRKEIRLRDLI